VSKLIRSYLFVPGDHPAMLSKAGMRGADALIVDLEDAVAPRRKQAARQATVEWLGHHWEYQCERWIRVNSGDEGLKDLAALEGRTIHGLVIPKTRQAEDVAAWADRSKVVQPELPLIVLIETARSLRDIDRIAEHPAVHRLMIGEADLGADLGLTPDNRVWDSLRAEVVVASAAAGLQPPIGPVDPDYSSPARTEIETRRLRDMGFGARAVIHPAQIDAVHRAFRPSPRELAEASRLIADHERALAGGDGVHLDESGRMVDAALVRRARRLIALASRHDDNV
jgi:citrate lyase subunit beta/citryl-CoA lyase